MSDWLVQVYDECKIVTAWWIIEDCTEAEAHSKAENEIDRMGDVHDWSLTLWEGEFPEEEDFEADYWAAMGITIPEEEGG